MQVTIDNQIYTCRAAYKEPHKIILYLGEYDEHDTERTAIFAGLDTSTATIEGGEWLLPPPDPMQAQIDALTIALLEG